MPPTNLLSTDKLTRLASASAQSILKTAQMTVFEKNFLFD